MRCPEEIQETESVHEPEIENEVFEVITIHMVREIATGREIIPIEDSVEPQKDVADSSDHVLPFFFSRRFGSGLVLLFELLLETLQLLHGLVQEHSGDLLFEEIGDVFQEVSLVELHFELLERLVDFHEQFPLAFGEGGLEQGDALVPQFENRSELDETVLVFGVFLETDQPAENEVGELDFEPDLCGKPGFGGLVALLFMFVDFLKKI